MEDENKENDDSQIVEDVITDDNVDDDAPTLEDYQKIKEEKEKLEAKNKQLYARLHTSKPLQKQNSDSPDISKKIEELELKTEGYNKEEIEFLTQYGGKKALDNPIVKTAIEVMREKSRAENAVVDSNTPGGDIEKKYTQSQLDKMSVSELEELISSSK